MVLLATQYKHCMLFGHHCQANGLIAVRKGEEMKVDELELLMILVVVFAQRLHSKLRKQTDTWVSDFDRYDVVKSSDVFMSVSVGANKFETSGSHTQVNAELNFHRSPKGSWRRGYLSGSVHFHATGYLLHGKYVPGLGIKVEMFERHGGPKIGEFVV